jgi:hypothetical protein
MHRRFPVSAEIREKMKTRSAWPAKSSSAASTL